VTLTVCLSVFADQQAFDQAVRVSCRSAALMGLSLLYGPGLCAVQREIKKEGSRQAVPVGALMHVCMLPPVHTGTPHLHAGSVSVPSEGAPTLYLQDEPLMHARVPETRPRNTAIEGGRE